MFAAEGNAALCLLPFVETHSRAWTFFPLAWTTLVCYVSVSFHS